MVPRSCYTAATWWDPRNPPTSAVAGTLYTVGLLRGLFLRERCLFFAVVSLVVLTAVCTPYVPGASLDGPARSVHLKVCRRLLAPRS